MVALAGGRRRGALFYTYPKENKTFQAAHEDSRFFIPMVNDRQSPNNSVSRAPHLM